MSDSLYLLGSLSTSEANAEIVNEKNGVGAVMALMTAMKRHKQIMDAGAFALWRLVSKENLAAVVEELGAAVAEATEDAEDTDCMRMKDAADEIVNLVSVEDMVDPENAPATLACVLSAIPICDAAEDGAQAVCALMEAAGRTLMSGQVAAPEDALGQLVALLDASVEAGEHAKTASALKGLSDATAAEACVGAVVGQGMVRFRLSSCRSGRSLSHPSSPFHYRTCPATPRSPNSSPFLERTRKTRPCASWRCA